MANNITATLKLNIGHGVVGTFYRRDDNSIIIHIADNMEAAHGEGTTKHAEKIPLCWRPSLTTHIECCLIIGESFQSARHLEYVFFPSGDIYSYSKGNTTVPVHVVGNTTYMMHENDIKEARNPAAKQVNPTKSVNRFGSDNAKGTRYVDSLINGARGTIEMFCVTDDIIRTSVIGEFTSGTNVNGLHIGTIPTGDTNGHHVLYPVLASETVRDFDAFIQINADGRIYMMGAKANKHYTFDLTLPVRY